MKRLLILIHRYLGIPLSVVFVVWFVSGIVMIYTGGMPSVTPEERRARQAPLDVSAVALSPGAALAAARVATNPGGASLRMLLGRPAYRFDFGFGTAMTVFADNGSVPGDVSSDRGAEIAAAWLGVPQAQLSFTATREVPNQWTLALSRDLPLHEYAVDDGRGTRIYVGAYDGEVALVTSRASRLFAWIGVIPHWFYFTPLRLNQPAWYWTVVAVSAVGCLLAAIGLVLAVTQFRRSRPFSLQKSVRYRGLMAWHYYSGALFGVFTLTWVFSGLMSMEPFGWTREQGLEIPRSALTGGTLNLEAFSALGDTATARALDGAAQIDFVQVLGQPYLLVQPAAAGPAVRAGDRLVRERLHQPYPVTLESGQRRYLVRPDASATLAEAFDGDDLVAAIAASVDAAVTAVDKLDAYDAYYYSRDDAAPLPVLRIRFDDPLNTWAYVDPIEARIVSTNHRYSRIERWLFNGLHSLDFRFWYDRRPLWDVGMIALSLGALLSSGIGMWLGFGRLFRGLRARRRLPHPIDSPGSA